MIKKSSFKEARPKCLVHTSIDENVRGLAPKNSCRPINFADFTLSKLTHRFNKYFKFRSEILRNRINMTFYRLKGFATWRSPQVTLTLITSRTFHTWNISFSLNFVSIQWNYRYMYIYLFRTIIQFDSYWKSNINLCKIL